MDWLKGKDERRHTEAWVHKGSEGECMLEGDSLERMPVHRNELVLELRRLVLAKAVAMAVQRQEHSRDDPTPIPLSLCVLLFPFWVPITITLDLGWSSVTAEASGAGVQILNPQP